MVDDLALASLSSEYAYRADGPRASLLNMFREDTPQGPRQFSLRGRPGLVLNASLGTGQVYWVEEAGGARYANVGNSIYRNGTLIGAVSAGGTRQVAKSESQLVFTAGGNAYVVQYDTTPSVLSQITDSDLPAVSGVFFAPNGRFNYPHLDEAGRYSFSAVGDATTIDGLDFATAESDPDTITRGCVLGDNVLFFGPRSIENHRPTSDPDAPLVRNQGLTQTIGCESPYAIVLMDNELFFPGLENGGRAIYRTGGGIPVRVSTPSIDAHLEAISSEQLAELTAFSVVAQGHSWYVVNVPGQGSFAIDRKTQGWAQWSSYERDVFRVRTGSNGVYGGDDGKLYTFSPSVYDDNGAPLIRVCAAFLPVTSRGRCNVLNLECSTGVGLSTGRGSEPVVEHRFTDEVTGDWTDWEAGELGVQGDRAVRVSWPQQGLMHPPGRYEEFRCSDPVAFVANGVTVNARP